MIGRTYEVILEINGISISLESEADIDRAVEYLQSLKQWALSAPAFNRSHADSSDQGIRGQVPSPQTVAQNQPTKEWSGADQPSRTVNDRVVTKGALVRNPLPGQRSADFAVRAAELHKDREKFTLRELVGWMQDIGWVSNSNYKTSVVRDSISEDRRFFISQYGFWSYDPSLAEPSHSQAEGEVVDVSEEETDVPPEGVDSGGQKDAEYEGLFPARDAGAE